MKYLVLFSLLTISTAFAQGRAPAVEDFVGVEGDYEETTPSEVHALYNFEKDVMAIQELKPEGPHTIDTSTPVKPMTSSWWGITGLLTLPLVSWGLAMRSRRKKLEARDNVTPLPVKKRVENDQQKKAS